MSIAAIEVPVESVVLDRLGDPAPFEARGIVLAVAHPDDETIGVGAVL